MQDYETNIERNSSRVVQVVLLLIDNRHKIVVGMRRCSTEVHTRRYAFQIY